MELRWLEPVGLRIPAVRSWNRRGYGRFHGFIVGSQSRGPWRCDGDSSALADRKKQAADRIWRHLWRAHLYSRRPGFSGVHSTEEWESDLGGTVKGAGAQN